MIYWGEQVPDHYFQNDITLRVLWCFKVPVLASTSFKAHSLTAHTSSSKQAKLRSWQRQRQSEMHARVSHPFTNSNWKQHQWKAINFIKFQNMLIACPEPFKSGKCYGILNWTGHLLNMHNVTQRSFMLPITTNADGQLKCYTSNPIQWQPIYEQTHLLHLKQCYRNVFMDKHAGDSNRSHHWLVE